MDELARYERQFRFPHLGVEAQRRLLASRVLVCGCGALGSVAAELLARAGVGFLRLADRDVLELSNLQRQSLYDEADVAAGLPKAIAAANRLRRINSHIQIEPVVADVTPVNIEPLISDVDLILDGTDNFPTRFLLNDAALKWDKPWIFGGCIGSEGQSMTIVPQETPCFRCLLPEPPAPGTVPTCETAGILGSVVAVVASIQVAEALKILSGHRESISRELFVIDLWENRTRRLDLQPLREQGGCATCRRQEFPWLAGQQGNFAAVLCGRNAVHLSQPAGDPLPLAALAARLTGIGQVVHNEHLLRLTLGAHVLTVFSDGRAIVSGTDDVATARALYARYVGE